MDIYPEDIDTGSIYIIRPYYNNDLRLWTTADKSTGTQLEWIEEPSCDYFFWDLTTTPVYPTTIYVEGIEATGSARDEELSVVYGGWNYDSYGNWEMHDTIAFSVMEVDLDMDANHDGEVDDNDNTAGEDEWAEENTTRSIGAVIAFDASTEEMTWQILPTNVTGDSLRITEAVGRNAYVEVYEDAGLTTEVSLPVVWAAPWSQGPPQTLYVAGKRPSEEVSDLEFVLKLKRGTADYTDSVHATVVQ